jgi:predicted kinase
MRLLLSDDEDNQNIHALVFRTMRYILRQRLAAGAPVTYIDATSLARWERRPWIQFAHLNDCDIEAVHFDTPLDTCLERNRKRKRVVPPDVIRSMSQRLAPPSEAEGFSRVEVVRP